MADGMQGMSPMEQYMADYAPRLQSMLEGGSYDPSAWGAQDGQMIPASSGLGPDLYPGPQPSALAMRAMNQSGGAGATQPSAGPSQSAGPPGAALQQQGQSDGQQIGFRDLYNGQSAAQRKELIGNLEDHLKTADQSIDGAYKQMMQQLGQRPVVGLSKQDKGMLLMEFGLHMMQNSSGKFGYGQDVGAAVGASGVQTLQSARGLMQAKQGQQLQYDKLQQQLAIAQGREKSALAGRMALEAGRDVRAWGREDSLLARTQMQGQSALQRTEIQQSGQNQRQSEREQNQNQAVTRTVIGQGGEVYGVNRSGQTQRLTDQGKPITARAPAGGKGTAATNNYDLYMKTFGVDPTGKPLTGDALRQVQQQALTFSSNPRGFAGMSDADLMKLAEKGADSVIRATTLTSSTVSPQDLQAERTRLIGENFQRLKRNGTIGPAVKFSPQSSGQSALPNPRSPSGAAKPTQADLQYLRAHPEKAALFSKRFGYLPPEFSGQSALGR